MGPSGQWLCDECEQRLSRWEKPFAEHIFEYVHRTSEGQEAIAYGPWALKFAASMSWRTLLFYADTPIDHVSAADLATARRAEERWRRFLLDEERHPGPFEQHVLFVDAPAGVTGAVSPFISRYLARTVHLDLLSSRSSVLTYAKLGRVIVFGFIRADDARRWKGTKLHVRDGVIGGSREIQIPQAILDYWNAKADAGAAGFAADVRTTARKDRCHVARDAT